MPEQSHRLQPAAFAVELALKYFFHLPHPESHPDFMAMEALRQESTPEERATTSKVGPNIVTVSAISGMLCVSEVLKSLTGKALAFA